MSGEQDMRKMAGSTSTSPGTYVAEWIGKLALAGVPFFAGDYSMDTILEPRSDTHTTRRHAAYWSAITAAPPDRVYPGLLY